MTYPPELVTLRCPSCGTTFQDWYRASINAELAADDEYIRAAGSATCPRCQVLFEITPVLIVKSEDTDDATPMLATSLSPTEPRRSSETWNEFS